MYKKQYRSGYTHVQGRKPTDKDFDPFWELKNRYIRVKCGPNCSRNRAKRWTNSPICAFSLGSFTGLCLYLCFAAHYYRDVVLEQPYWPLAGPPSFLTIKDKNTAIHEPIYGPLPFSNQSVASVTSIACIVISTLTDGQDKSLFFLARIRNTWGSHCTHLVASGFRGLNDTNLIDTIPALDSLSTIYSSYGSSTSWFVIAPETSHVHQENLASLLRKYNHSQPYQLGHAERVKNVTFISSTAGYILSNEALRRVVQAEHEGYTYCQGVDKNLENFKKPLTFGICLTALGIELKDMRDGQGGLMFVPGPVSGLILGDTGDYDEESSSEQGMGRAITLMVMSMKNVTATSQQIAQRTRTPAQTVVKVKEKGNPLEVIGQGLQCCSPGAIIWGIDYESFIFNPDYYLYHLNVFGVKKMSP